MPSLERLLCLRPLPAERVALGLQSRPLLRAGRGGVLRPRLHRGQLGAQVRRRLLGILAQRALQLRRELGTQLLQLPLECLYLTRAFLVMRPRSRERLARGVQFPCNELLM
ncbi:hypothetical protein [Cupriavidus basilensis]